MNVPYANQVSSWIRERYPNQVTGAEIGVYEGRFSEYMLRRLPQLTLYMVDPWTAVPPDSRYAQSGDAVALLSQAEFDEAKRTTERRTAFAADRRRIINTTSVEAAARLDAMLDFVFIDADHSYEGVRDDLHLWAAKVRPGGVVSGHDMDAHPDWGVRRAVEEYIAIMCPDAALQTGDEFTWMFINPAT